VHLCPNFLLAFEVASTDIVETAARDSVETSSNMVKFLGPAYSLNKISKQINDLGYVVIPNLLTQDLVERAQHSLQETVLQRINSYSSSQNVVTLNNNALADDLIIDFCREFPHLVNNIFDKHALLSDSLFELATHESLLSIVSAIIGDQILFHPSFNIHPRLPGDYTVAHQDAGYYLPDADKTLVLACIVPMVATSKANGCLWVADGQHKRGILPHDLIGEALVLREEDVPQQQWKPVLTKPGDVVIITSMTPHGSFVNLSSSVRWSIDFRYQAVGLPTGRAYDCGFVVQGREAFIRSFAEWLEVRESWLATQSENMPLVPSYRWEKIESRPTNVLTYLAE
jgi:ectoine hydroxylase-related dioxygenase (phytanoyl-CoA dioxygenase family)